MTSVEPDPAAGTSRFETSQSERVWSTLGPQALRYATVLVGPDDAHDVFVTAFLRIDQSRQWSELEYPQRFLFRAITNEAKNHRRQVGRRMRRDTAGLLAAEVHAGVPNIDLMRAVARLSIEQRSILLLTYWEDMTEAAVADLLGLSAGTVHHHLARARDRLRKALR